MKLSVIGLGKLGLCTATCFASKGHQVIGVEKNIVSIEKLRRHENPISENGLDELLEKCWDNFSVTNNIQEAVQKTSMTLIIVPTPSDSSGRFSNKYVILVLEEIARALKYKSESHEVVIISTVMPGSCEKEFIPVLEGLSGKECGKDFGLVYNPEFIALGSVIHNFMFPDMVLIGASDPFAAGRVEELYSTVCENKPYMARMSLVSAEITKLSLNCYVTMKISFMNELGKICERVPDADVDDITRAIGTDRRVGSSYSKSGLGFGGPCFPRDNLAFQRFAKDIGTSFELGSSVIDVNKSIVDRIISKIVVTPGNTISVLGLSYKPGTHIVEESQSIELIQKLLELGYEIKVYDPQAMDSTKAIFGDSITYCGDVEECVRPTSTVILMTNWSRFGALDLDKPDMIEDGTTIIDSWRVLKDRNICVFNYIGLGLGEKRV